LFKSELITAKSIQLKAPNLIKPDYLKLSDYALIKAELSKRPEIDDLLLFDTQNILTEASTSNVFIVGLDQKIYTPKTSSMVLDGIYRKNLIQFFKLNHYEIVEGDVFFDDVIKSSEILLTNSIKGVRRVLQFEKNIYNNKNVFDFVINKFGQFGEKFYE
jgi:branched-subunit amino acid aminotransferase/4-amino-4-deoxychorismate lyase